MQTDMLLRIIQPRRRMIPPQPHPVRRVKAVPAVLQLQLQRNSLNIPLIPVPSFITAARAGYCLVSGFIS